jgi:predicted house-cleaning noncanonical NTP pyrophosphatase (MazG superfamily)
MNKDYLMKMRTFYQNKLWRDKAVEKMEKHGSIMHWRRLDDAQYSQQLLLKLVEEAQEVVEAQSGHDLVEELADVLDVVDALCVLHGITSEQIAQAQATRYQERGGFSNRVFVEKAEHPEGSFGVEYCLAQPQKYPEIIEE